MAMVRNSSLTPANGADDEQERQQRDAVEDAVDGDGAQGGHLAHLLALADDVGADELAGAGGNEVVGHEANDDDGEERRDAHLAEGSQQVLPAPGAEIGGDEVDGYRRQRPPVVGVGEGVADLTEVGAPEEYADEQSAQGDPEPDAGAAEQQGPRFWSRAVCPSKTGLLRGSAALT